MRRSGTIVHTYARLSKAGNTCLRDVLYLPAPTAVRFNHMLKVFYKRITANEKSKMAFLRDYTGKLRLIAAGILEN